MRLRTKLILIFFVVLSVLSLALFVTGANGTLLAILLIILIVSGLGLLGWYLYTAFFKKSTTQAFFSKSVDENTVKRIFAQRVLMLYGIDIRCKYLIGNDRGKIVPNEYTVPIKTEHSTPANENKYTAQSYFKVNGCEKFYLMGIDGNLNITDRPMDGYWGYNWKLWRHPSLLWEGEEGTKTSKPISVREQILSGMDPKEAVQTMAGLGMYEE